MPAPVNAGDRLVTGGHSGGDVGESADRLRCRADDGGSAHRFAIADARRSITLNLCEVLMTITLSDEDVQTLRGLLEDRLPALEFEVARTDARDMRHLLIKRQELCERLLDQLRGASAAS